MKYIFGIPIKPAIQIIQKEGIPTLFGLLESKEVKQHLHIITKPNSKNGRKKLGFNTFMDVGSHLAFQDLSGITEGCGCIICQYRHKMHQTERKIERLEKEATKYYRLILTNPNGSKLKTPVDVKNEKTFLFSKYHTLLDLIEKYQKNLNIQKEIVRKLKYISKLYVY